MRLEDIEGRRGQRKAVKAEAEVKWAALSLAEKIAVIRTVHPHITPWIRWPLHGLALLMLVIFSLQAALDTWTVALFMHPMVIVGWTAAMWTLGRRSVAEALDRS